MIGVILSWIMGSRPRHQPRRSEMDWNSILGLAAFVICAGALWYYARRK